MALTLKDKKIKYPDDTYIVKHFLSPYNIIDDDRYKHIDTLELYDGKKIKATMSPIDLSFLPYSGVTTGSATENRIDLMALKYYGASKFYWILCYMNNISDPLELPINIPLMIPDISAARKFPNALS